jgi:hypothetical protein
MSKNTYNINDEVVIMMSHWNILVMYDVKEKQDFLDWFRDFSQHNTYLNTTSY